VRDALVVEGGRGADGGGAGGHLDRNIAGAVVEIAVGVVTLAAAACLAWSSLLMRRHGLAGCLYLLAARTRALADAVAVGQERHRRSVLEYVAEARTATRAIQEAL
jgi:hypothetical protein